MLLTMNKGIVFYYKLRESDKMITVLFGGSRPRGIQNNLLS